MSTPSLLRRSPLLTLRHKTKPRASCEFTAILAGGLAYNDKVGFGLCGAGANCGFTQFVGMPFTPRSNATVMQVRVAVQYNSGTNQVNLSLYNDVGGVPGTVLAGPVTVANLPSGGTCCTLAIANFESGVAVTAGVQYWVVANMPASGPGSDFNGAWDFLFPTASFGIDTGTGWFSSIGDLMGAAGAVLGTIP